VLLPGAPAEVDLPPFLSQFTWLDLRGGLSLAEVERLVWGITGKKRAPPRTKPAPVPAVATAPPAAPAPDDADLAAYRAWALDRYRGMALIGLGAADIRMRFEEVYVPLRIARRPGLEELEERGGKRLGRGLGAAGSEDVEVEEIFSLGAPHALILGHPGAGKTTALLKLLHTALAAGRQPPGLAVETVPSSSGCGA
jgi:hypothetical protein